MLLLFIRKYRPEVFENNTKVTFIFFNVLLMIFITTLVVNYNSKYVYVVPICILPLVLKAFFDARLGLFAHVITVLLLGFIVSNSYEYMFLQVIAGIVTILTVSELYKRANLFISVGQITLIYIVAYFAFFVIHEGSIDALKWETFGLFILCGLATLFVQPLIYAYEKLFGLVSDVSLLELSDTNTKLLKELSNKAPGTFHHSLNVLVFPSLSLTFSSPTVSSSSTSSSKSLSSLASSSSFVVFRAKAVFTQQKSESHHSGSRLDVRCKLNSDKY